MASNLNAETEASGQGKQCVAQIFEHFERELAKFG